ncbi:MAG TPA: HXXEE domain-containing protein [Gemmatimonadales bacterium]|nr:HXXEE domain-containing protein [Gemmatimonadales bacterium]
MRAGPAPLTLVSSGSTPTRRLEEVMLAWAHQWLIREWHWPQAALFTAILLFLLLPVVAATEGLVLALVFLQFPLYLVHQFEEHEGDRFRRYFNDRLIGIPDGLTPEATFWINALGVWGVILAALYLAVYATPAWGLIALYLSVINGVLHVVHAITRREYNPGLWTSLALLLPLGGWSLAQVSRITGAPSHVHVLSAGFVAAVHLGIVAYVLRMQRVAQPGAPEPRP